jgi:predicted PurR-regulated permease PerM
MTASRQWFILAALLLTGWLVYLLSPILTPFVISAILAYLGDPITDKLETCRLSRTQAVLVVFFSMILLLALAILLVIPQLDFQIADAISRLPAYAAKVNQELLPWLAQRFGLEIAPIDVQSLISALQANWQKAGGVADKLLQSITHSGSVVASVLMNLLLIPVVTFYLLRDWDIMVANIYRLLPKRAAPLTAALAGEVDAVLSSFLRGQFYVMLALGVIYSLGLSLVGLDTALLIGMMAGMISFVPYMGAIIGFTAACIAAVVQFHAFTQLIYVALVFMVGQTLEGTVLTPKLVGDKIGLHPVAVIFSVLAGGQLFGFLGILLALPVASIVMVLVRHVHDLYKDSAFYGDGADDV